MDCSNNICLCDDGNDTKSLNRDQPIKCVVACSIFSISLLGKLVFKTTSTVYRVFSLSNFVT